MATQAKKQAEIAAEKQAFLEKLKQKQSVLAAKNAMSNLTLSAMAMPPPPLLMFQP
jgi:hypothetical protein